MSKKRLFFVIFLMFLVLFSGAAVAAEDETAVETTVYVGGENGSVYAVDASDGTEVWSMEIEGAARILSSPTVVNGTVYFGSIEEFDEDSSDDTRSEGDPALYAVDAETGDEEWVFTDTEGPVFSSPTVVDGRVYFGEAKDAGGFGGGVYSIDAETGEEEWSLSEPIGDVTSRLTVVDGKVFFNDADVHALETEGGRQVWSAEEHSMTPTVSNGTVYTGDTSEFGMGEDGIEVAEEAATASLDATTGDLVSESSVSEGVFIMVSPPTVVDGTVYVGYVDSFEGESGVYAFDAETMDKKWSKLLDSDVGELPTLSTASDGIIYVGVGESQTPYASVYAVDSETGDIEWEKDDFGKEVTSPTVAGDAVYVTDNETLYSLNKKSGEVLWHKEGEFTSTPTIVDTPTDGDSIDSQVILGTLGHHEEWAEKASSAGTDGEFRNQSSPEEAGGTEELPGFGFVATVLALVTSALFARRRPE